MNKNCIASLLFILVVLTSTSTKSQSNYNVNLIPAELKSNARAVIRKDLKKLEVFTPERAVLTVQYAITVLNKNGIDDGIFKHPYNKFMKLNVKKAIVYDFNGEKLKKIPFGDMYDFSAIDNTTTFDDNRMKVIDPEIRDFPFTVEYEYELVFKGTLNLPSWRPYPDYEIAIEHSEMVIQAPEKPGFRYFERNIERNPNISKLGTGSIRSWSAENLKAVKEEPYSGPMTDFLPTVDFSMNSFSINGMPGDASSWNSFGKWIYDLNKGRDLLSVTTAEKITKLIEGSHSNADRIKIIYNYMQNNTRYVSVQVGIGGWQAFEAETVDRLSYGDCKALSNYMQSLLKSVGIESYYTLVYAGSFGSNIQKEFPSNQFNHVILCVPDRNDTLWLECTNQSIPFGYLGSFTDDRDVLLVKETGGEIVHTPVYTSEQNQKITKAQVTLYENGFGEVSVLTIHKGIFYDEARDILLSDDTDRKKKIYQSIQIPHFTLKDFELKESKDKIPDIAINFNADLGNYSTMMGDNIFFDINLMNKIDESPKKMKDRLSDIQIRRSTSEIDTIVYSFILTHELIQVPDNITITTNFGSYHAEFIYANHQLTYIRKLELLKGIFPKEEYHKLIQFFDDISVADHKKIAIKMVK